jgi:V/A-type H+-transporting ATPase subunit I
MTRVRIAGPRPLLDRTLAVLQDLGVLHVDRPHVCDRGPEDQALRRERRHVVRCLSDVEAALECLHPPVNAKTRAEPPLSAAKIVRRARRVRHQAEALTQSRASLEEERSGLIRYHEFFEVFEVMAGHELTWPDGQAFYVILKAGTGAALTELTRGLAEAVDGEIELLHRQLSSGELAVLILTSSRAAPKVSALLSSSRVDELPAPAGLGETSLLRAVPAITRRLAQIHGALRAIETRREALACSEGGWLAGLRAFLRDQLLRMDARDQVFAAEYLFVIEGWLPDARCADLQRCLASQLGPEVIVSRLGTEEWAARAAPVTLHNPPLFRPFEVVTRMLPLPRYGTIDPTPFVAIFFPAFFGLMVGDVGYGLMLAALAAMLWRKSRPGSSLRSVSTVALACSASAIVFGLLFGEFFGSLGPAIGLRAVFNREEAAIPFLGLAVALGGVHVVLGLVLAGVGAWRGGHRRKAVGRGVALAMLVLTTLSLLAACEVLPDGLLTPLVVTVFVAFTALIALEGIVALIELLSTFAHILSYARIMALGTASLMLAMVANEMVGAFGSALIGIVFALLFHLVNFAIAVFSPTIHALRLHYVEFFGEFFSPGGAEYRPLGHWHPSPQRS